jgi:hypothetical protein
VETHSTDLMSQRHPARCGRSVHTFFDASSILFRGCGTPVVRGRRHSVTELTLASPHSIVQWRGWPHRAGGRQNSAGVGFPGGVRGSAWWGFALDSGACGVPEHLVLWSGARVRRHGPVAADPL